MWHLLLASLAHLRLICAMATGRGVEAMDNSNRLLDRTVYGRQETWEGTPAGWLRHEWGNQYRADGRPIVQWPRLKAGDPDALYGVSGE